MHCVRETILGKNLHSQETLQNSVLMLITPLIKSFYLKIIPCTKYTEFEVACVISPQ